MKALHFIAALLFAGVSHAAPLKLFTDRPKDRLDQALVGFTQTTGIAVEVTVAPYAELKAKIQGGESADVLLLKDLTSITDAAQAGLFIPMNQANRKANVDSSMRDSQGLWTALAYRIRTIAIDPAVVSKDLVKTYESLSGRKFSGQLCMRNAKEYTATFVAWLISRYGEAKAQAMVDGWKSNLAVGFTAGDTASFKSIESGACAAAIGNHYYLARLKAADSRFPVELVFADQDEGGLHTSGFGGGLLKATSQAANANSFLGYMLTSAGQKALTAGPGFEFPAVKNVLPEAVVASFGQFKISNIHWTEVGAQINKANAILERAEWEK
jgi:iron(III) transport system substrate-binding protein